MNELERAERVARELGSEAGSEAGNEADSEASSEAGEDAERDRRRRLGAELVDAYDEELEMEVDDLLHESGFEISDDARALRRVYFRELIRLQGELVKMQDWIVSTGHRLVVIFEGRDAAGKGGVIKRITQRLNPRMCRVAALPAPNNRERTQWYFQRYVQHLPAGGEMVLFDRSWYNRAGVERVMNFCTDEEYEEFFRSVPEFEKMLVRSGIQIVKYWFSITDDEQEVRFQSRIEDPLKQWKLSPMDLESRRRWEAYTHVKEVMLQRSHIHEAPWWVVQGVDKKRARLNCIHHLLSQVPYHEVEHASVTLPARVHHPDYIRQPVPENMIVPDIY
ncbi:MAG TPA: polyphosphate kinase 2 [Paraburkholderia sp.]|nr:polyphosphate kinase 2 [Paraburkholderia sp.]